MLFRSLIFTQIRVPRVLLAAMVGAALAVSGAALQPTLRNPLASPDIIGVSGGAALAAVAGLFFGDCDGRRLQTAQARIRRDLTQGDSEVHLRARNQGRKKSKNLALRAVHLWQTVVETLCDCAIVRLLDFRNGDIVRSCDCSI